MNFANPKLVRNLVQLFLIVPLLLVSWSGYQDVKASPVENPVGLSRVQSAAQSTSLPVNPNALASGKNFTCAITSTGGVKCWGVNYDGQLGDGSNQMSAGPVDVSGLNSGIIALTAGEAHVCALTAAGGVKCWGRNWNGQLGNGANASSSTPVEVSGLGSGVIAISAGQQHTCALTSAGGVKCWGRNWLGQLGNNSTNDQSTPGDVSNLTAGVVAISNGNDHTCAVTSAGAVKCWGLNDQGQLGDNTTDGRLIPGDVSGLASGVSAISAGAAHTCALTSAGAIWCWGNNTYGQLGDNTTTQRLTPAAVSGLTAPATMVSTRASHTCALTAAGGVMCWGSNDYGQLGNGTTLRYPMPIQVSGLEQGVRAISTGTYHTCALLGAGWIKCWGHQSEVFTQRAAPVRVTGLPAGIKAVAAGQDHTCVITATDGVKCWGANSSGQLGDGTTTPSVPAVDVSGLSSGVTAITTGFSHTCALTSAGEVKCWGYNGSGQVGDGSEDDRLTPVTVLTGATALAAGAFRTCALTAAGGVSCWGDSVSTPTAVSGLSSGVAAISGGYTHNCALTESGGVKCWGYNYDGLGDGATEQSSTPVDVSGLSSGVVHLSAGTGGGHTCAITDSGAVKCWGNNYFGQLGDGTSDMATPPTAVPVDVVNLGGSVLTITAGGGHTCTIIDTNSSGPYASAPQCWGWNASGQLGDQTNEPRLSPVNVANMDSALTQISAGYAHTCALTDAGEVECWGENQYGQLGVDASSLVLSPARIPGITGWISVPPLAWTDVIAGGFFHTCALTRTGGVKCWGRNDYGQLGYGTTISQQLVPTDVVGLTTGVVAVSAKGNHTCALTTGGGVKCWGDNQLGQLGDGTTTQRLEPVDVSGLTSGIIAIAAGNTHSCALTEAGGVKCWGSNQYGQLGDNTTTASPTPVDVSNLSAGVIALTIGDNHTCALTGAGGVKCWGNNTYAQLGDLTVTSRSVPTDVSGLSSGVTAITAGVWHTCALTSSGGVKCWGNNSTGQLGDNTLTSRRTPGNVSGATTGIVTVAAGKYHTCALTSERRAKCWGYNVYGNLGDRSTTQRLTAVDVVDLGGEVTALAAGGYHTCVLTDSGGAKCWGFNAYGELGQDTNSSLVPVDVSELSGISITASSTGFYHTCALTSAGGVKCWGFNNYGEVGDGTTTQRLRPVNVSGLTSGVTAVVAGVYHSCALTSSGGVKCWGYNNYGQLGDGTTTQRLEPVDVSGLTSGVIAISANNNHTCALTSAGGVKCWGYNGYGQLGNNTTTSQSTPVDVSGLSSGITAVSSGFTHTCALTSGGGVKCWGRNDHAELGDNSVTQRLTPVDVTGLTSGVSAISAGGYHTCALLGLNGIDGVKCWGNNSYGQIGHPAMTSYRTPVSVDNLTPGEVKNISAGLIYTCATTNAGTVKCWGNNTYGQLGNGTLDSQSTPQTVTGLNSGMAAVIAGAYHTCAITDAGGMKCWGYNRYGQLGDGTSVSVMYHPINAQLTTAWLPVPRQAWKAESNQANASLGWSVSAGGDIKGSGHSGLLVGAPYYGSGGAVFVYYGAQNGLASAPDLILTGSEAGARFGWAVASAGDVNRDGYADVIVGAIGCSHPEPNEGCSYVYLGSAGGLSSTPAWSVEGNQANAFLGYQVGLVGDVNGDSYSDIFVTAPNYTRRFFNEGMAYVYHGSANGLNADPAWAVEGGEASGFFGLSASSAGDVNGDGLSDLIVGAPNASTDQTQTGKAFVYLGSPAGLSTNISWIGEGTQANAHFGAAVSRAGDLNGDGFGDVVVGAPDYDWTESDAGGAYVFYGSPGGLNGQAGWAKSGQQAGARLGATLAWAGDVNQDGYDDLLIGSHRLNYGQENEGAVYLYYGSAGGVDDARTWLREGNQSFGYFAYAVKYVGDINADGIADFVVGAPLLDNGQADEGRVYLYYGAR